MKVWLDDLRKPPFGWDWAKTADECIWLLAHRSVEEVSLDHDLAEEHYDPKNFQYIDMHGYTGELSRENYRAKTGYAVVEYMVRTNTWPPKIWIHTLNPVGQRNMVETLAKHSPDSVEIVIKPATSWPHAQA